MADNDNLRLQSNVTSDGLLEFSIASVPLGEPAGDEVLVRVEAAPINPSDLGVMFAVADMGTAKVLSADTVVAEIPEAMRRHVAPRVGKPVPLGNEGAGVVVATGDSPAAKALAGKTVALLGGSMYARHRIAKAAQCLVLPDDVTPVEGASCFVNPLTALGMVETMKLEGHKALVHTAAASNLGQMLVKLCQADGVPMVNIVRRQEHVQLLRGLGAEHVCNSSEPTFMADLVAALTATGATVGFDATGGGRLAGNILTAMEAALTAQGDGGFNRYGSSTHKQVYIYGGLDRGPTELMRSFGMAWGIGGWLLPPFLERIGPDAAQALRERVAREIKTTFASSYTQEVSLRGALALEAISRYAKQATGEKFLVRPQLED